MKRQNKAPFYVFHHVEFSGKPVPGEGAYSEHESEIRKNFAKFCRIFGRILQEFVEFEKC